MQRIQSVGGGLKVAVSLLRRLLWHLWFQGGEDNSSPQQDMHSQPTAAHQVLLSRSRPEAE